MAKFIRMFGMGVLGLYLCLVLYNLIVWLPVHFGEEFSRYYLVETVLFPNFFVGLRGLGVRLTPQEVWEVFAAPVLVMGTGAVAFLRLKGRLRLLGAYLILLSSFCLTSLFLGLLVRLPEQLYGWRTSLLVIVPLLVGTANFWCFYRLYRDPVEVGGAGLARYFCTFLLPSAIVTFLTAGGSTILVGRDGSRLLFYPSSAASWDLRLEGWGVVFLTVISIGAMADERQLH